MMASFPPPLEPEVLLKPKPLVKKDQETKPTSGPMTSTQTESSKMELIKELLDIIAELSDVKWQSQTQDDLNISITESDASSQSTDCSSDWEMPPYPPMGGPPPLEEPPTTHPNKPYPCHEMKIKYTPF
nr:ORF3 [Torque teno felis virus]